jgi:hypothetical protein
VAPVAPYLDPTTQQARYEGNPRKLYVVGDTFTTKSIKITHDYAPNGEIRATYTNGILSTQNLLQQLESLQDPAAHAAKAGPTTGVSPGLLTVLRAHIQKGQDPLREFLTADVLSFLLTLVERSEKGNGVLYLALYELNDPELIARLTALVAAGKAHVILSTAGSFDPNPKKKTNPPAPRLPMVWDTTDHEARGTLHTANAANVQDRLFNNTAHIGHNKFTVYVENGVPMAVLTGSTNWTYTGLCTQSNNAILIENQDVAAQYLAYWKRLETDPQPAGVPASSGNHNGFAPNNGVQGAALRTANAKPVTPITLADGKTTVELYFTPNTKAATKNAKSPTPVDLSRVYSLMEHAQQAILFLTFLPSKGGEQSIVGEAATLAKDRPELLVLGAISDPTAMPPNPNPEEPETYTTPDGETKRLPYHAIWWPEGENSRVVMIRAAAVTEPTGDLKPELLTAGAAIIHDKIIVIDPLDPDGCTVITGSHNLGYKASYSNDENLLVIRGNQALALSYAVHVLDVYDHYVIRAKLEDELRDSLLEKGVPPQSTGGGFLETTADEWQKRWFEANRDPNSRDYFLSQVVKI